MQRLAILRLWLAFLLLLTVRPASGHAMPCSDVILSLHRGGINARLILPLIALKPGWQKPLPMDAVQTIRLYGPDLKAYVLRHVRPAAPDGRPWLVAVRSLTPLPAPAPNAFVASSPDVQVDLRMTPPPNAPTDRIILHYDVIFHRLITHTAIVSIASDWRNGLVGRPPVLLGTMRDTDTTMIIDRSQGSWFQGFVAMFRLGARHIAEGTDHLLFLLALLLPAPLIAVGGRWGGYAGGKTALLRIVKVVTAFTVGHSITLVFGALGWVRLPGVVVESAIALSILVSAVHALVPIFRGRELFIAGGFGLVHGLAFAATLTGFGFDTLTLASSVLGFNLGIEAFQLVVILTVMPWLVLLARSQVYGLCRIIGAALTGIAAAAWFTERAFGWGNPIAPLVERLASHTLWLLVGLVVLSVGSAIAAKARNEAGLEVLEPAQPDTCGEYHLERNHAMQEVP